MRLLTSLFAVLVSTGVGPQAQVPRAAEYLAFRVDDERLVATVLVRDPTPPQIREGLSPAPAARYGYPHFAVPSWWQERQPFEVPQADRWAVHVSPDDVIDAVAEEVVGGYSGCQEAVGVLLRAMPPHASTLAASPARYFVASPSTPGSVVTTGASAIGTRPVPSSAEWRAAIEAALDELLARELPRVRSEAAPALSRMESSTVGYHRSWARERRRVETAMERGESERVYDVQPFQLGPGQAVYFVRAEWLVDGLQGFAASLWLRTEPRVEIIEQNLRPASWLRMFEFQGRVTRDHLGLVLNVIDRDQDGRGEILFLQAGYEGFSISVREYADGGFEPARLTYGGGC
jgi:hypothetical protein